MASALTVLLLGCWLAGQSRAWAYAGSAPTRGTNSTLLGTPSALTQPASAEPDPAGSAIAFPSFSALPEYISRFFSFIESSILQEPSDPLHTIVADAGSPPAEGTDPTLLEPTTAPTQPASAGPGGSGTNLSGSIVTGLIVGATSLLILLLLLLLLAFLRRRRTRSWLGPALR